MDVKVIRLKVKILVERDDDTFHAYCPDLKGLHVGGDTEKEAVANAVEAFKGYMESLIKHNEPIPVGLIDGEAWYERRAGTTLARRNHLECGYGLRRCIKYL